MKLIDVGLKKRLKKGTYLYILLVPLLLWLVLFKYLPMFGIVLAFKSYSFKFGILGSQWVGFENFSRIFAFPDFWRAVKNTVVISFLRLLIEFPAPILLAILIYEMKQKKIQRLFQTIVTFPHFLSWVIIFGMLVTLLGNEGVVNQVITSFGGNKINFMTSNQYFRSLLVGSNLWKEMGWGTIIYLATMSGIDPQLYEATEIDGGNRWHKLIYITLPSLIPTIIILLILFLGSMMSSGGGGFNQVFNLYNSAVFASGDIIDTYVYRQTFATGLNYGLATAIGLFKSVFNFVLVFSANYFIRVVSKGERGLF